MNALTTAPGTAAAPAPSRPSTALLRVEGYSGHFGDAANPVLHDVSFEVPTGSITAIVGETGSGKSLTLYSVLQVQPPSFVRTGGTMTFDGMNLLELSERELRAIRGRRISLVFQDARAALNPVFRVGEQLAAVRRLHAGSGRKAAWEEAVEALRGVHIPEAERRARQYPHEFSGGMAQRVMIAMALLSQPELLILDEPTTGLDVTIQSDIMALITELTEQRGLTACLITHDLGVVAETCRHVVVMHHGRVVETGTTEDIFLRPQAEYTRRLLAASRLGGEA